MVMAEFLNDFAHAASLHRLRAACHHFFYKTLLPKQRNRHIRWLRRRLLFDQRLTPRRTIGPRATGQGKEIIRPVRQPLKRQLTSGEGDANRTLDELLFWRWGRWVEPHDDAIDAIQAKLMAGVIEQVICKDQPVAQAEAGGAQIEEGR